MNEKEIHDGYQKIWDEFSNSFFSEILNRGFVFQYDSNEINHDILFIGINPAYKIGDPSVKQSYSKDINFPYFKSFQNIVKNLKHDYNKDVTWSHLDLFSFRETNQKYIESELIKSEEGLSFLIKQLEFAKKRIEFLNPKIIIVSNALARRFFGKDLYENKNGFKENVWMGFEFKFDKEIGTDKIISDSVLKNTPVFFTSMLSGQRAIDNGSKERLIWHINEILK